MITSSSSNTTNKVGLSSFSGIFCGLRAEEVKLPMATSLSCSSNSCLLLLLLLVPTCLLMVCRPSVATQTNRKLNALVQPTPLVLTYHNGPLLKGNYDLNLVWYGSFTPSQKSIIIDFLTSFNAHTNNPLPPPSVSSWWKITEGYRGGGMTTFSLGKQLLLGTDVYGSNILKSSDLVALANRAKGTQSTTAVTVVLTSADVAVERFCSGRCGTHGAIPGSTSTYIWVGNSAKQCPGQCAWPFHQPIYGPQTPPLVAPNGDVGIDGMVTNLATLLAGIVTNPYGTGYFQGPKDVPLEAVSACTGIFGKGAYPGYPGQVLVDEITGANYNARGLNGRKYLLPAIWDPKTSQCSTLV